MTDEQINQRIAEACGWTEVKKFDWLFGMPPNNAGVFCRAHNYAGCLNAMHGAEKTLMEDDPHAYGCYSCGLYEQYGNTVHLSAAQRAEAFLRTIGKWEEEA